MGKRQDPLQEALEERDDELEEEDQEETLPPDEGEEGQSEDDNDEGEEEDDDWTPPSRKQWEAYQAKLKRANKQAQRLREKYEPKGSKRPATSNNRSSAQQNRRDDERREREREAERREEQLTLRAVRGDAKAGLLERGADPELVDLAISKLKASEIEFDDDDEPILDDWYEEMEERYPKLFGGRETSATKTATRKPARTSIDQGQPGRRDKATKTKSFAEQLLESTEGRRGRR